MLQSIQLRWPIAVALPQCDCYCVNSLLARIYFLIRFRCAVELQTRPELNTELTKFSFSCSCHAFSRQRTRTTLVRRLLFGLAFAELIRSKSLAACPLNRKARSVKALPSDSLPRSLQLSHCPMSVFRTADLPPLLFGDDMWRQMT